MDTGHNLFILLRKPFSNGYAGIIVIGPDEDQDGIEVGAMFSLQLIGLSGNIIPLTAADAVHIGFNLEPVLQETPILLF